MTTGVAAVVAQGYAAAGFVRDHGGLWRVVGLDTRRLVDARFTTSRIVARAARARGIPVAVYARGVDQVHYLPSWLVAYVEVVAAERAESVLVAADRALAELRLDTAALLSALSPIGGDDAVEAYVRTHVRTRSPRGP